MSQARTVRSVLDQFLERYGKPSATDVESAGERVWRSVSSGEVARLEEASDSAPVRPAWRLRWPALATGVAALVLAVFLPATVMRSAPAVLEDGAGSRGIQYGELVRSNGGGTLKFPGGVRVEMRAESEVSFERSGDGVVVRVRRGDVIANAAEQTNGQVSVETKDMSAVGNVFLVSAKEEGSRVAAITGETRVQQGTTDKKLVPGEQVATSPGMESIPAKEEGGWSRQAISQLALLQSVVVPTAPREEFEVVSIRRLPSAGDGGRGGIFTNGQILACYGSLGGTDPSRLRATKFSVYHLILMAYGKDCGIENTANADDLILHQGPEWIWSEQYDIDAVIPPGPPAFTMWATTGGGTPYTSLASNCQRVSASCRPEPGPRLRAMLQAMLADRFKLVLRRETKESPVYFLRVGKGGAKLTPWKDGDRVAAPVGYHTLTDQGRTQVIARLRANKASLAQVSETLRLVVGRHVLDRTGIVGEFNFEIFFAPEESQRQSLVQQWNLPVMTSPTLRTVLEDELGLRLETGRAPVEVLSIDRVERPSEN